MKGGFYLVAFLLNVDLLLLQRLDTELPPPPLSTWKIGKILLSPRYESSPLPPLRSINNYIHPQLELNPYTPVHETNTQPLKAAQGKRGVDMPVNVWWRISIHSEDESF